MATDPRTLVDLKEGTVSRLVYSGRRDDVLRKTKAGWRIARRKILLDQNVVLAKNLSVFF